MHSTICGGVKALNLYPAQAAGQPGNMRAPQGQYQTLLIDMDDTLYRNPRMPILMRENIQGACSSSTNGLAGVQPGDSSCCQSFLGADCLPAAEYMKSVLRIPEEQVPALCTECYATYGTTMAGLEVSQHALAMQFLVYRQT